MTTVLHIIATLDRGGTEVTALAIAREFSRRGLNNRVAALEVGRGAIAGDFAAVAGEPTLLLGGRVKRAWSMLQLIKHHSPDAVLFHIFNTEHIVLGVVARLAGTRSLAAVLGNPISTNAAIARKVRRVVRITKHLGIRVLVASRWIERSLAEAGCSLKDVRVVHNGCDVEGIRNRADVVRSSCTRGAVVGMISRLDTIKDHATLLEAFALLPQEIERRQTRLILVGDGNLRTLLETQAERLGITDRTTFVGARRDIPEFIATFDVFAFSTTRDEGFGVVLIEALAAGTPVVASDVPACHEVLEGGALGLLVPPGDPKALAAALHKVLVRPVAVPANSEIAKRYGIAAMANAYLAVLFSAGLEDCAIPVSNSHSAAGVPLA